MKFLAGEKKQRGFTLLELMIVLVIANCLVFLFIPVYQESMKRKAWEVSLEAATPLKRAIGQCLLDSKGDVTSCNDFSAIKLAKYGVTNIPQNPAFIATLTNKATVIITGFSKLGRCTATLTPSVRLLERTIEWKCVMQKQGKDGDSLPECRKHIDGCL